MLEQKFAALKALRQRLAHRLLNHTCTRKADQRFRFANVHIAEHRQTCRHAAGRRIREHRDIGKLLFRQACKRRARLCHLQQREQRFLHTRTAARRKADERLAVFDAMLDGTHETLADHRTHGAGHELELERAGDDRNSFQGARHHDQRIFLVRALLSLQQAVAILLAVAKLERIFRLDRVGELGERLGIEETLEPLAGTDAHVMSALRTHMQIAFELGSIEHGIARRTLHPQPFRNRARAALRLDPGRHDFFEPGHTAIC